MGHAREAAGVGDRTEVRGGNDDRRRRFGRAGERRVQRAGQDAVREPELDVDLRSDEGGLQAREDEAVDRAAVDGALHDDALAALGDGQAGGHVALRGAVGEKPGPPCPPRFGGQAARDLVRRGRAAGNDVDALDERREVERERGAAQRLAQAVIGRGAALVPGHHGAARLARCERDQRFEIRRQVLAWVL